MKTLIKLIRKPIFWTNNSKKAAISRFEWFDWHTNGRKRFGLSLLGIINGFLPRNIKLVVFVTTNKMGFLKFNERDD